MDESSPLQWHPSKLVLLRLWFEPTSDGGEQICGKVQSVVSGETQYFKGGDALAALLSSMLRRAPPSAVNGGES